jgi:ABC-type dipeptide/oligopeptide/nickel transport system ATPase component
MYLGQILEQGSADQVFAPPYHPYTEALLAAVPLADPHVQKRTVPLADPHVQKRTVPLSTVPLTSEMPVASKLSSEMPVASRLSRDLPAASMFSGEMPVASKFSGEMPVASKHSSEMRVASKFATEMTVASNPPGCRFHERCAYRLPGTCDVLAPPLQAFAPGHAIACHLPRAQLQAMAPVFAPNPCHTGPSPSP